ncbi:MAG: glycoside hydrolase family 127 protein [Oscillospiraceae bacterium]|nr:glycoside hydrolase family 127 protein [Oscillospiraceae bacterium]
MKQIRMLASDELRVTEPFLRESFRLEREYLLSLRVDRLLAGFREAAGLAPQARRYGGWESLEIRGHTMGHWLTAMSHAWSMTKEPLLLERINGAIDGLALCQRDDGYLFASGEELFERLERGEEAWVPWYTMDKLLSGLLSAAELTPCEHAEGVLRRLADWIARRALGWTEETRKTVLAVEYGGMNDCLYRLYAHTGEHRYAEAAHCFDELPLLLALAEGKDVLDDLHANTTIPKVLGFARRYAVTDGAEPRYLQAAERFWKMVVKHHSYINGGNSEWERFGPADRLDAERTEYNCETCNVYNMLKLSQLLFSLTGKKQYADYDAWAYTNSILSSQNHETGMSTYFQPMASGFFKVYSTREDNFWCCTGTGMENFTKPWAGVAFADEHTLYLNRLVSCVIDVCGLHAEVRTDWLNTDELTLRADNWPKHLRVALRVPSWSDREGEWLYLDGSALTDGCASIRFPRTLRTHTLPDAPNLRGYSFGPFVLSASYDSDDLKTGKTGVDVTVPLRGENVRDWVIAPEVVPLNKGCRFILRSGDGWQTELAPHFLKNQERYAVYFRVSNDLPEAANAGGTNGYKDMEL